MTCALPSDFKYVESVVKNARSSFAAGMKALPKDRRGYLFGIYAYCRVLDDISDSHDVTAVKLEQLTLWREKTDQMIAGNPACPITRVLCDALNRFDLPKNEFYQLLDGMQADICGPVYRPDWNGLYTYCRQVACSVGLLCLPIFGRNDDGAKEFALEVGYALQLTNILRDVQEDYTIGRLYLPDEALSAHNVTDLSALGLRHVLLEVAQRANDHYERADYLLKTIGRQSLHPAILMKEAYRKLFEKMERRGWHVLSPRMSLSTVEKLMIVMKTVVNNG